MAIPQKKQKNPGLAPEKRKTYSLDGGKSRDLARHAIDMSEKLGKTVNRQEILDALVGALKEKPVYEIILKTIKNARG